MKISQVHGHYQLKQARDICQTVPLPSFSKSLVYAPLQNMQEFSYFEILASYLERQVGYIQDFRATTDP